jgi:osmotically-inducible protein OsmY
MNAHKSDLEIQRDVLAELAWEPRVQPNEIGVAVKAGVVTLTGVIDSFYKKWASEEAAHRVRGVVAVANDLQVQLPTTSERTDEDIARAAVEALKADAVIADCPLRVTVSNGWIAVGGEAEWQYQKEDAERTLQRLWGVRGVTNLIAVKAQPTADELEKQIADALARRGELDASDVHVRVEGHKAILEGEVRTWAERQEAERAAWAPGITQIEDHIQIRST